MAKNPENINPFNEEEYEEQERLYGKDKLHAYVPIEQVADKNDSENEEDYLAHEATGLSDKELAKEADQKRIETLRKELKFHEEEGVASVGPDVIGTEINVDVGGYHTTGEKASMSPDKVEQDYFMNKKARRPDGMKGHENLKTMPDRKKVKTFRGLIRNFFTKQNYKETPEHLKEETYVDNYEDEVTLNGRPIDKKILGDIENDKAA